MSAQAFANTIITKLKSVIGTEGKGYGSNTAILAMQAVADAITEYLLANTTVTVSYVGTLSTTPPSSDPVVADTFQIVGQCATTGICSDFGDWLSKIEANIIAGFQLAPMGTAGIAFPTFAWANTGITTVRDTLKGLHTGNEKSPQQPIWEQICQDIMTWGMSSGMNITPGAATRASGPSAGVATITAITIN